MYRAYRRRQKSQQDVTAASWSNNIPLCQSDSFNPFRPVAVLRCYDGAGRTNEVALRRARLVLTRVTVLRDMAGVPQGSVLGLLFFATYCSPISSLCHLYGVQQQQYADDTQLYIALSPSDPRNKLTALQTCLTSLQTWFYTNGMALNPDKSSAILLCTAQRASSE